MSKPQISSLAGTLFPLTELPDRPWMLRRARAGRPNKLNKSTCVRWAVRGKRGLRLKTILVGGIRCTCDAWAWDFFNGLTRAKDGTGCATPRTMRGDDHAIADAELQAEGF